MKKSELKQIIKEEISKILNEEVEGNKLYLYHRTKAKNAKQIAQNNFTLTPGGGRVGIGTYFVYDTPAEIKSGMDAYGGVSLRYSIPKSSLLKFLIFDKELQSKTLYEQLKPYEEEINSKYLKYIEQNNKQRENAESNSSYSLTEPESEKIYKSQKSRLESGYKFLENQIKLYDENKLKQLNFIEILLKDLKIKLPDLFDGILYSTKGSVSGGALITGTAKTAVVYNQSLLTFEGISTDGINYKKISNPESETKSALKSPEYLLKRNQVPANSTIKKSFMKLTGARNLQLPAGLKIVGSLDLRNIPNLVIPDDLEVTNSLYISKGINIPDAVRAKAKNINIF